MVEEFNTHAMASGSLRNFALSGRYLAGILLCLLSLGAPAGTPRPNTPDPVLARLHMFGEDLHRCRYTPEQLQKAKQSLIVFAKASEYDADKHSAAWQLCLAIIELKMAPSETQLAKLTEVLKGGLSPRARGLGLAAVAKHYRAKGLPGKALELMKTVEIPQPDLVLMRALCYHDMHDYDAAIQEYRRHLKFSVSPKMVRYKLAKALCGAGRFDEARDVCSQSPQIEVPPALDAIDTVKTGNYRAHLSKLKISPKWWYWLVPVAFVIMMYEYLRRLGTATRLLFHYRSPVDQRWSFALRYSDKKSKCPSCFRSPDFRSDRHNERVQLCNGCDEMALPVACRRCGAGLDPYGNCTRCQFTRKGELWQCYLLDVLTALMGIIILLRITVCWVWPKWPEAILTIVEQTRIVPIILTLVIIALLLFPFRKRAKAFLVGQLVVLSLLFVVPLQFGNAFLFQGEGEFYRAICFPLAGELMVLLPVAGFFAAWNLSDRIPNAVAQKGHIRSGALGIGIIMCTFLAYYSIEHLYRLTSDGIRDISVINLFFAVAFMFALVFNEVVTVKKKRIPKVVWWCLSALLIGVTGLHVWVVVKYYFWNTHLVAMTVCSFLILTCLARAAKSPRGVIAWKLLQLPLCTLFLVGAICVFTSRIFGTWTARGVWEATSRLCFSWSLPLWEAGTGNVVTAITSVLLVSVLAALVAYWAWTKYCGLSTYVWPPALQALPPAGAPLVIEALGVESTRLLGAESSERLSKTKFLLTWLGKNLPGEHQRETRRLLAGISRLESGNASEDQSERHELNASLGSFLSKVEATLPALVRPGRDLQLVSSQKPWDIYLAGKKGLLSLNSDAGRVAIGNQDATSTIKAIVKQFEQVFLTYYSNQDRVGERLWDRDFLMIMISDKELFPSLRRLAVRLLKGMSHQDWLYFYFADSIPYIQHDPDCLRPDSPDAEDELHSDLLSVVDRLRDYGYAAELQVVNATMHVDDVEMWRVSWGEQGMSASQNELESAAMGAKFVKFCLAAKRMEVN